MSNSPSKQRTQQTSQEASQADDRVKPEDGLGEQRADAVNANVASSKTEHLMEQVVARERMLAGLRRVEQNGGAPGADGMNVDDLRAHLKAHWESIKVALLADRYIN